MKRRKIADFYCPPACSHQPLSTVFLKLSFPASLSSKAQDGNGNYPWSSKDCADHPGQFELNCQHMPVQEDPGVTLE